MKIRTNDSKNEQSKKFKSSQTLQYIEMNDMQLDPLSENEALPEENAKKVTISNETPKKSILNRNKSEKKMSTFKKEIASSPTNNNDKKASVVSSALTKQSVPKAKSKEKKDTKKSTKLGNKSVDQIHNEKRNINQADPLGKKREKSGPKKKVIAVRRSSSSNAVSKIK